MRAFRVAYDGRPYHGFQRQPDVPTVADRLLDACRALGVAESVPAGYAAAGRTDRGVSALAQTVAFESPDWLTPRALNAELPDAIRAWAHADVPEGFHATHDATARRYVYHHYAPEADPERARAALDRLAGRHDFHNLTPDETGTVRDLSTDLTRAGDVLEIDLRADGFARQLVRRVVSLVAGLERVDAVLGADSLSGPEGVAPAPPGPLVLAGVTYPDATFEVDDRAAADARAYFGAERAAATARARVAETIRTGVP